MVDRYHWLSLGRALIGAVCLLGAASTVGAITFELNFTGGAVNPNDPDGSGLMSIVQEAADRWADILEDDHTITLNVSYYENDSMGNGPCGNGVTTACAGIVSANAAQNRTVEGYLRFYANRNWYIDATPGDDSEFDLSQTRYVDLTPEERSAGYSGLVEPLLEVGFRGGTNFSDPDATGASDMLSTAVHEIGHHLGVTNQFQAAREEYADDDYDLPPVLLAGAVMAVEAVPGREFHFVDSFPLMSDQGSPLGSRRLPTAADVFAAAAVSGWSEIDLPRQDFLSGTSWGTPGNWIGNRVPDADDAAFIRGEFNGMSGTGDVLLDQNDAVASLFVGKGSNLRTGAFRLDVGGTTTIDFDGTLPASQIILETGGELETEDLVVSGGSLEMAGGRAGVQNRVTITDNVARGSIAGFGTVEVQDSLVNNGLITAEEGILTFTSTNAGDVFDLDGAAGEGEVRANLGDLLFAGNIHGDFAGVMTIGAGRFIEFNNPWRLSGVGTLNLGGDAAVAANAQLRGAPLEVDGHVSVDQGAELQVPLSFNPTAVVSVPDSDDRLSLEGAVTYNRGTFTGNGTVEQNGFGAVVANQQIDMDGTFDWDGAENDSPFLVNSGKTFALTATTINRGDNIYRGQLSLIAGSVSVDVADDRWTMDGMLKMSGAGGQGASIAGDPLDVAGTIETNFGQTHSLFAPSRFLPGSTTHVDADSVLQFGAPVTWLGGEHSGAGALAVHDVGAIDGGMIEIAELQIGTTAALAVDGGTVTTTDLVIGAGGILEVRGGDFTVDGGTGNFGTSFGYGGLSQENLPTIRVENGADVTVTSHWRIGEQAGEFGMTRVRGTGNGHRSTLRGIEGGDAADLVIGHSGNGVLNVAEGGRADFGDDMIIGSEAGSEGLVTVTGGDGSDRSEVLVTRGGADATLYVGRLGSGELRIENGARLQVGGDTLVGSEIEAVGTVHVSGSVGGIDASVEIGGALNLGGSRSTPGGTGHVAVHAGGMLAAKGATLWPSGRMDILGGQVVVDGDLVIDGGMLKVASGASALTLGSSGSLANQNGGTLSGSGTITLGGMALVNNSVVAPGDSIGDLPLQGGLYVQEQNGTLQIEIGGADVGNFDRLMIMGSADLAGLLEVQFVDSFQPELGDAFDILTATEGVNGRFATTENELPQLTTGLEWLIQYGASDVILEIAAAVLRGDYNGNGRVEQADLDLVLLNWGSDFSDLPQTWINGRPTEGIVDQAELDGVLLNWGNASSLAQAGGVPEPATILLLVVGAGFIPLRKVVHRMLQPGVTSFQKP